MEDRIRLIERRDVDELIILDVSPLAPRFEEVKRLCEPLFCPITIGGGIKNVADIQRLLAGGADKVAINSMAIERPEFVKDAATRFGAQAIVVAANVISGDGGKTVVGHHKARALEDPINFARQMEHLGAGEILLTSVDRDGMMGGYDLELIKSVSAAVSIPVMAAGGCGSYEHMLEAMNAGAHAVASGAAFQFREMTPRGAARYLNDHGIPCRI